MDSWHLPAACRFSWGWDEGRNVLLFVLPEPRSSAAISHVASLTEAERGNGMIESNVQGLVSSYLTRLHCSCSYKNSIKDNNLRRLTCGAGIRSQTLCLEPPPFSAQSSFISFPPIIESSEESALGAWHRGARAAVEADSHISLEARKPRQLAHGWSPCRLTADFARVMRLSSFCLRWNVNRWLCSFPGGEGFSFSLVAFKTVDLLACSFVNIWISSARFDSLSK